MSTPVGHGLFGLSIATAGGTTRRSRTWLLGCVLLPLAPDLDFIPGILTGDANRFHQQWSHSFTAALLVGTGIAALALRMNSGRWLEYGVYAFLLYSSHLLMDFFVYDARAPFGQPLLWPFADAYLQSPWTPLHGIRHGVPGQAIGEVIADVFSWRNVIAMGRELAFVAAVTAALAIGSTSLSRLRHLRASR